jgi:AraC-like DNA-binding protein
LRFSIALTRAASLARLRQVSSRSRQHDDPSLVRTFGLTLTASSFRPPLAPGWDVLVVAAGARAALRAGNQVFALVAGTGVWVPDGLALEFELRERGEIRIAYVRAGCRAGGVCGVAVTPLLSELVSRAIALGAFDGRIPAQRRLAYVFFDEVAALLPAALALPLPRTGVARCVAERLLADPGLEAGTAELAGAAACSRRTLERIFAAEVGLGVAAWRRRLRLLRGLEDLARGRPVTEAAFEAGYGGVSAFIAAFRREFGVSPRRFVKRIPAGTDVA